MSLSELFKPRLTKAKQKTYKYKELEKRKRELTNSGYKGVEYKNKVFQAMQELEREIKNGIFRIYHKPTAKNKKAFQSHILENDLLPLFNTSDNIRYQLPQSIKSDIQFTNHISKQNLFSTIFPEFKRFDEGNWQPCIFTKDNVGWITKDKNGYYRYCSKSLKTGVIYGFSLLDLIEISYGGEYVGTEYACQVARKWLATTLNVSYRDFDFFKQQKSKYESNLKFIDNALEWKLLYPNLFAIAKSQLYVLVELHEFASQHIMERRHAIKKEAVYFVSTRKLCDDYKEKYKENYNVEKKTAHSTIAAAINLFCTLGFLHKIPSKTIQHKEELLQIARSIQGDKKHHHLINFMTIPHYDNETLRKAEKTAKRLRKFNITTAKDISSESLISALGEKKANEIIHVREVSLMKMHPDKLAKMAEEEFEEFPWEAFEQSLEKSLEVQEEDDYCILDSPLFKMNEDELYERSLWHFEQQEDDNELE